MARAALDWSTRELAERSGVGQAAINRFERGNDTFVSTVDRLRHTAEDAGLSFIPAGETGEGVCFRTPRQRWSSPKPAPN